MIADLDTLLTALFPRLLGQSEYNQRIKDLAPLTEAALRWLAQPRRCL